MVPAFLWVEQGDDSSIYVNDVFAEFHGSE